MTNQFYLRFYMIFVKWGSFAKLKIEIILSINLLLCASSSVLAVVQNYVVKAERTLYERCVEHTWSDRNSIVKNHLDQCVEVQYLLSIASLSPALFSNDNNIGSAGNKNSRISFVIDNTDIIDHCLKILTFLKSIISGIQLYKKK